MTFKKKKLDISDTFPSKKLTIILQNEQQQHMTCTDHLHWHDMSTVQFQAWCVHCPVCILIELVININLVIN